MRIWLDDIRPMPEDFDWWCKTAEDCIRLVAEGDVTLISFDHDLGNGKTGYDVAKFIEEMAGTDSTSNPISWQIHSANPVGRDNIAQAMTHAWKFWSN